MFNRDSRIDRFQKNIGYVRSDDTQIRNRHGQTGHKLLSIIFVLKLRPGCVVDFISFLINDLATPMHGSRFG